MITTVEAERLGELINAIAESLNFATTDEQEAVRFVDKWSKAKTPLKDRKKFLSEVRSNLDNIYMPDALAHYQAVLSRRLLKAAKQLNQLCRDHFNYKKESVLISSDELDPSFFGQELNIFDSVVAEVETSMQRLIAVVEQEFEPLSELESTILESTITDQNKGTELTTGEIKNNFNNVPLDEVRRWFMLLANSNSKNGAPFLTVDQVNQFIDRAFVGNTNGQKLTINIAEGERTSITKLFYLFFQRCIHDYEVEPTKHCKEKYVRLLTDNFTNYNYDTVFDTFNNSKNAAIQWKITV